MWHEEGLAIAPDLSLVLDHFELRPGLTLVDSDLETSTLYQIGFHPPNFSSSFMARMDSALDLVDEHLFEKDAGPAVYVNISELTRVWK